MIYLDSAAVVKLVHAEAESAALRGWLGERAETGWISSVLTEIESELLQDVDPALPQVLGDRRLDLGRKPVVVHASTIAPDARAALPPASRPGSASRHRRTACRPRWQRLAAIRLRERRTRWLLTTGRPCLGSAVCSLPHRRASYEAASRLTAHSAPSSRSVDLGRQASALSGGAVPTGRPGGCGAGLDAGWRCWR